MEESKSEIKKEEPEPENKKEVISEINKNILILFDSGIKEKISKIIYNQIESKYLYEIKNSNKIPEEYIKDLNSLINEFNFSIQKEIEDIEMKYKEEREINLNEKCQGCSKYPMKEKCYMCTECKNFFYCQDCKEKYEKLHGHPLIEILNDYQLKKVLKELKKDIKLPKKKELIEKKKRALEESSKKFEEKKKKNLEKLSNKFEFMDKDKQEKINEKLGFVNTTNTFIKPKKDHLSFQVMDKALVFDIEEGTKSFKYSLHLSNDGNIQWPVPCYFKCRSLKHQIKGNDITINDLVKINDDITLELEFDFSLFEKLSYTDRYTSKYCLYNEHLKQFGSDVVFYFYFKSTNPEVEREKFEKNFGLEKMRKYYGGFIKNCEDIDIFNALLKNNFDFYKSFLELYDLNLKKEKINENK